MIGTVLSAFFFIMFDVFIDISDLAWGNFDTIVAVSSTHLAGPPLFKVVATAEKLEVKSILSKVTISSEPAKMIR